MERHMFPGGNTSAGFYSYYAYILPQSKAEHIYVLKGGPGVGKSTFMMNIGKRAQAEGYNVEYLHCSSDPDSLDGICIPDIRIALIDGTAPHVIDPANPGAVDEIVNLGEFWNLDGIKHHKREIIAINSEVKRLFERAYKYLAAAKCVMDDVLEIYRQPAGISITALQAEMIIHKEFMQDPIGAAGSVRKQFASAITPSGLVQYLDTLIDETYKIYLITSNWGIGVSGLLGRIALAASERSYETELYYCPMDPAARIEHLIIPGKKLAFFSGNKFFAMTHKPAGIIDMTQYKETLTALDLSALGFNESLLNSLLNEAILSLKSAKDAHDEMEQYYVSNMDFASEKEKADEITGRILESAGFKEKKP